MLRVIHLCAAGVYNMGADTNLTPEQIERIKHLQRMTPAEYDAICKRCGVCCLHKLEGPLGVTYYMKSCCEHLNPQTRQCAVYANRLSLQSGRCCKVTPQLAAEAKLVPTSCGYVEYIYGPSPYPAKVDFAHVVPMSDEKWDIDLIMGTFVRNIIQQSLMWSK